MIEVTGFLGSLFRVCYIIMQLLYINLLWALFSIGGFIVFGIFPATIAMFTVLKKMSSAHEFSILKVFWQTYKREYVKGNCLGLLLLTIGILLFIDIRFVGAGEHVILIIVSYLLKAIAFLITIMFMYVFPVYVSYEVKPLHAIKNALLIGGANPVYTLKMVIFTVIVICFLFLFPRLIPILGISLLAYVWMTIANKSFNRVQKMMVIERNS